jgi:hypothetical protein
MAVRSNLPQFSNLAAALWCGQQGRIPWGAPNNFQPWIKKGKKKRRRKKKTERGGGRRGK